MNIKGFLKFINYHARMEVLGRSKNFRYWIQNDLPNNQDIGEPLVVEENLVNNIFEVCNSDKASVLIKSFYEEKK